MSDILAADTEATPPTLQYASTNGIDLERVCPICLQDAPDLRSIFDHPDNIPEVMRTVAQLEVSTEDTFPKQICSRCVGRVETVVDFRNKCIQSYRRLAEYVGVLDAAGEATVEFVKIEIVDQSKADGVGSSGSEEITVQLDADGELVASSDRNESEHSSQDNTKEGERWNVIRTSRCKRNRKVIPRGSAESGATSCPVCNERVASKMLMKYHLKSDHAEDDGAEKVRRCFFCPKAYSTYQLLSYHLYFHPQKIWRCPECDKEIAKKSKFMDHLRVHANERHCECTICGKRFTTMKYLAIHRQTHRRRADQRIQPTERNAQSENESATDGDETEDSDEPNVCLVCDESFRRSHLLLCHLKSEHVPYDASEANPQPCLVCSREFVTPRQLQMHMHLHAGRMWSCPDCKEQFRKLSNFNEHRKIHFSEGGNLCVYCGKEFLTTKYLNRHLQTHTRNETKGKQKIYECEICGKQMKYKSNYTNHRKTHGPVSSKPPPSPEPDGGPKKIYLCNICGRDCGSSSNLTVHIRRHNGQSVCQCSVCGKGFPRRADMVMHMRKHTGEKPFECPTCGRGFSRRDKLRIHIRIHTGEKPYSCPCGRAYAQKNDLKTHQKRNSCGQNFDLSKLMAPIQTSICVKTPQDGPERPRRKSSLQQCSKLTAALDSEAGTGKVIPTVTEHFEQTAYSLPVVEFCEPA